MAFTIELGFAVRLELPADATPEELREIVERGNAIADQISPAVGMAVPCDASDVRDMLTHLESILQSVRRAGAARIRRPRS